MKLKVCRFIKSIDKVVTLYRIIYADNKIPTFNYFNIINTFILNL